MDHLTLTRMAHVNKVMKSIETEDGARCVDIFLRPDGTYGFEEFRRDSEDARGWFPIGYNADRTFNTEVEAHSAAKLTVRWLARS